MTRAFSTGALNELDPKLSSLPADFDCIIDVRASRVTGNNFGLTSTEEMSVLNPYLREIDSLGGFGRIRIEIRNNVVGSMAIEPTLRPGVIDTPRVVTLSPRREA
jgi:hypothetical protein